MASREGSGTGKLLAAGVMIMLFGITVISIVEKTLHLPAVAVTLTVLLIFAVHEFRRYLFIKNIPTATVRGLPLGSLVEVEGNATTPEELYTAPDGTECVFYYYVLEEYQMQGDDGEWVTIGTDRSDQYFRMEDDTGELIVDTAGADFELAEDMARRLTPGNVSPGVQAVLTAHGKGDWAENASVVDKVFDRDLRLKQYSIEPGETVYALGAAETRKFDGEERTVLARDQENAVHIIADKSEDAVARKRFVRSAAALLIAGIIAVAAAVWWL